MVPREMVMLRWLGVPEAYVRMVEGMYEEMKEGLVRRGMSEFCINISLKQGNALSPIMFIMVMELVITKVSMKDILRKLLYAVNLVGHRSEE